MFSVFNGFIQVAREFPEKFRKNYLSNDYKMYTIDYNMYTRIDSEYGLKAIVK